MGYCSDIINMPEVRGELKIKLLQTAFREVAKEYAFDTLKHQTDELEFVPYFVNEYEASDPLAYPTLEDDGSWSSELFGNNKHYADNKFAKFIAPYVYAGMMEFVGEDGSKWGYEFDGEGKVYHVEYEPNRMGEVE